MANCPHCMLQIPSMATRCPHCAGLITYTSAAALSGGIPWSVMKYFVIAGAVIVPLLYFKFADSPDFVGSLISIAIGAVGGFSLPHIPLTQKG
jgi:predicted amidophosphoribosyltransferase